MKRVLLVIIALVGFSFASNAQNQEQRAINKAEAAAKKCVNELDFPNGLEFVSSATVYQICDYTTPNPNYFGYVVNVNGKQKCAPNTLCPQVIYPIATVYVSCSGEVTEVICGTATE
ncbi:MAG: hypothetical protein V4622_03160 [Bacteroidota bacterium]